MQESRKKLVGKELTFARDVDILLADTAKPDWDGDLEVIAEEKFRELRGEICKMVRDWLPTVKEIGDVIENKVGAGYGEEVIDDLAQAIRKSALEKMGLKEKDEEINP